MNNEEKQININKNRNKEFLIEDQAEEPDIITDTGNNNFMEPIEDMSSILVQN